MKSRSIVVTEADMDKLNRLVQALKHSLFRDQHQIEMLDQALQSAEVRSPGRVPKNVVRMNSRVRVLDLDTREMELYTLAFPEDANISRGLISVLAPLGIALLGHRQGEVIEARVPGGTRMLKLERVLRGPDISEKGPSEHRPAKHATYHRRSQETALAL